MLTVATSGHHCAQRVLSTFLTRFPEGGALGQGPTLCAPSLKPTLPDTLPGRSSLAGRQPHHPAALERRADAFPSLFSCEGEMEPGIHTAPERPLWAQQPAPALSPIHSPLAPVLVLCQPGSEEASLGPPVAPQRDITFSGKPPPTSPQLLPGPLLSSPGWVSPGYCLPSRVAALSPGPSS